MRGRTRRGAAAAAIVMLVLTACGGSDEVSPEQRPESGDSGGGVVMVGGDLELPDFFPADFYLPEGLTIGSVSENPAAEMISLTGTFESGDAAAIQADTVAGLEAAGYELLSNDEIAVFVRNGVGRVRVRTSEFLGELTLSVDIDTWTDAQLDELRALFADEVVVPGRATAELGDDVLEAQGECTLKGDRRFFLAEAASITLQIDETQDPVSLYADLTLPDGRVFTTEGMTDPDYTSSPESLSANGLMTELYNEGAGTVQFAITATCDL